MNTGSLLHDQPNMGDESPLIPDGTTTHLPQVTDNVSSTAIATAETMVNTANEQPAADPTTIAVGFSSYTPTFPPPPATTTDISHTPAAVSPRMAPPIANPNHLTSMSYRSAFEVPEGQWIPYTRAIISGQAMEPASQDRHSMDLESRRMYEAAEAGSKNWEEPLMNFLTKDLPQAVPGVPTKRMENIIAEDLASNDRDMDNYYELRSEFKSMAEMHRMNARQISAYTNQLQKDHVRLYQEKIEAEKRYEDALAKADRDRANLEKQKREYYERRELRRWKRTEREIKKQRDERMELTMQEDVKMEVDGEERRKWKEEEIKTGQEVEGVPGVGLGGCDGAADDARGNDDGDGDGDGHDGHDDNDDDNGNINVDMEDANNEDGKVQQQQQQQHQQESNETSTYLTDLVASTTSSSNSGAGNKDSGNDMDDQGQGTQKEV